MRLPASASFSSLQSVQEGKEEQEKRAPAGPEMLFEIVDRAGRGGIAHRQ
jgi:hypothetical protein